MYYPKRNYIGAFGQRPIDNGKFCGRTRGAPCWICFLDPPAGDLGAVFQKP